MKIVLLKMLGLIILILTTIFAASYLIPLPTQNQTSAQSIANQSGEFITIDNYTGFYIDKNSTSPEVIVFLHGFGSSTYSWQQVTDSFNLAGYRTIAIDLKGFGMSQKGYQIDYSHSAQAEYVVAILTQLGVKQANFVGHSMGANVMAFIASKHPDLIQKMIFVDPALVTAKQTSIPWMKFPPFRRIFQQIMTRLVTETRLKKLLQSAYDKSTIVSDTTVTAYANSLKINSWELSLLGMVRDSGNNVIDITQINKALPTLIIWGANDSWVPVGQSSVLTNYFSNKEFVTFPNTGHVAQEEKPTEFTNVALPFLNK